MVEASALMVVQSFTLELPAPRCPATGCYKYYMYLSIMHSAGRLG